MCRIYIKYNIYSIHCMSQKNASIILLLSFSAIYITTNITIIRYCNMRLQFILTFRKNI